MHQSKNVWEELPTPFFILAPMDDVTDTVFRQIVVGCAAPDLFITEFVNVDGLQSPGRPNLLKKLRFTDKERPIIAQLWGNTPENYYKTARELVKMGFDGVDINMGCPVKTVIKNGSCIALINNRPLAAEIIAATREGLAGKLPLSVKTRLGLGTVDLSWHEFLLGQKLNALTIHGRTAKQLSGAPADWEIIGQIRELRDKIAPKTKIIGNGDVLSRPNGQILAAKYQLDGIMLGRGIFNDPFVFSKFSKGNPWQRYSKAQKMALYQKHIQLFAKTWTKGERNLRGLNKFCKIYINGFDGASDLRAKLMNCKSVEELLNELK